MKLLRYGPVGQEKPGMLDRDGKIRDLSGVVSDINGESLSPASLQKLRGVMATISLPLSSKRVTSATNPAYRLLVSMPADRSNSRVGESLRIFR